MKRFIVSLMLLFAIMAPSALAAWDSSDSAAWYKFENTSWIDSINGNNLTAFGSFPIVLNTTFHPQEYGSAQLEAASYLRTTSPTINMPVGSGLSWSMGAWFNLGEVISPPEVYSIMAMGKVSSSSNFKAGRIAYYNDGSPQLLFDTRGENPNYFINLNISQTYFVLMTYNDTTQLGRLFLNGEQMANSTFSTPIDICDGANDAGCVVVVGANPWALTDHPIGLQVDDARIYNFMLSDTQISNWANKTSGVLHGNQYFNLDIDPLFVVPLPNEAPIVTLIEPAPLLLVGESAISANVTASFLSVDDHNATTSCNMTLNGFTSYLNASVKNNTLTTFIMQNVSLGTHVLNVTCADSELLFGSDARSFEIKRSLFINETFVPLICPSDSVPDSILFVFIGMSLFAMIALNEMFIRIPIINSIVGLGAVMYGFTLIGCSGIIGVIFIIFGIFAMIFSFVRS